MDLAGERRQTGAHEQLLLLHELGLVAGVVPDLERQRHGKERGHVDGDDRQRVRGGPLRLQVEDRAREEAAQRLPQELRQHDGQQEKQVEHRAPMVVTAPETSDSDQPRSDVICARNTPWP